MGKTSWLEISLTVDGELAEAIAEVLSRYVPGGVAIEATRIVSDLEEVEGRPEGPLRVCGYLPMDAQLEEKRQRIAEALWYLGRIQPLPELSYRKIQEADWAEAWKANYRPISLGERLQIVPAWLEPPDPKRIAIRIDPGMAFGTGTHPTTQLCLTAIEDWAARAAAEQRAWSVIDVGCGSGILTIAALKLGAQHGLGVDVDQQAVAAAGANAALNGIAGQLELGVGSLANVLAGEYTLRQAPLVLANILAPVIIRLLDEGLGTLVTSGGQLVLSGILTDQVEQVIAAVERHRLRLVERRQLGDWSALIATPQD